MFSISNYDYDCTKKCKNNEHGCTITNALTKRSVDDQKLASFLAKTCRNFAEISDHEGRTGLHLASSVGRFAIAEWLINNVREQFIRKKVLVLKNLLLLLGFKCESKGC